MLESLDSIDIYVGMYRRSSIGAGPNPRRYRLIGEESPAGYSSQTRVGDQTD